ncbi:hypothetical protein BHE74_00059723 [Ensete ventricosum]|nr:hypothetical protein BHE74_00059723 [Ensete ventricosum]
MRLLVLLIGGIFGSDGYILLWLISRQKTATRRAEAWAGVERALNSRLLVETEAKAAAAEDKERTLNERLSQSLSRITVLETQVF